MPCQQITNTGISYSPPLSSRSGPFATEAECQQACKEGACCNGTTCSVKPQCQCECTTGSCCGPDIVTVSGSWGSMTGPACRNESKQACLDRGGTWRCGVNCTFEPGTLQELEQGLEALPCIQEGSGLPSSGQPEPVFKGIGTVCEPNPCYLLCDASEARLPVTTSGFITGGFAPCPEQPISISVDASSTLPSFFFGPSSLLSGCAQGKVVFCHWSTSPEPGVHDIGSVRDPVTGLQIGNAIFLDITLVGEFSEATRLGRAFFYIRGQVFSGTEQTRQACGGNAAIRSFSFCSPEFDIDTKTGPIYGIDPVLTFQELGMTFTLFNNPLP